MFRTEEDEGGIRRNIDLFTGEYGTISLEITGYLVHLYSWLRMTGYFGDLADELSARTHKHADWLCSQFSRVDGVLSELLPPFEPDSDLSYFFDTAIAVRGLEAARMSLGDGKYRATARFGLYALERHADALFGYSPVTDLEGHVVEAAKAKWSLFPGPWQLKGSQAFLALGDKRRHLDCMTRWERYGKDCFPFKDPLRFSDNAHPYAYWLEGLASVASEGSAEFNAELDARMTTLYQFFECDRVRTDALSQYLRLSLFRRRFSPENLWRDLVGMQDDSGGFLFSRVNNVRSYHISTHATIFAIQALVMNEGISADALPQGLRLI